MDELETMMVAAEAVRRKTVEALAVSALQQAHAMSHRAETTAESLFHAHKDMTVTTKEQARKKQLDFLESMKVYEEVYVDDLPAGTHVMSGRWVDTTKTPTVWRCKYSATFRPQQQYRASVFSWQDVSTDVVRDTKLLWQTAHKLSSTLKSVKENSCTCNCLKVGHQNFCMTADVWKVRQAMLGLRTSPSRWQEHLSNKLKERGFIQDERDPCLFVNVELDICIGVHVDDMLAVGQKRVNENAVAGTREGHGNALGHGDRQTTRVLGSFFVQDATRLQLWGIVRTRDTDVQGLWFWPTPGFQHTQFRENRGKIPFWTTLENAVTDSCLGDHSGWIVLTSKTQSVNCPLTSAQLPLVTKSTSSVC